MAACQTGTAAFLLIEPVKVGQFRRSREPTLLSGEGFRRGPIDVVTPGNDARLGYGVELEFAYGKLLAVTTPASGADALGEPISALGFGQGDGDATRGFEQFGAADIVGRDNNAQIDFTDCDRKTHGFTRDPFSDLLSVACLGFSIGFANGGFANTSIGGDAIREASHGFIIHLAAETEEFGDGAGIREPSGLLGSE